MSRLRIILVFICFFAVLSIVAVYRITSSYYAEQKQNIFNKDLYVNELKQEIDDKLTIDQRKKIIYTSADENNAVTKPPDDISEIRHDIDTLYELALSYYRSYEYERAIYYFNEIVSEYSHTAYWFDNSNPIFFSKLFLYKIYSDIYKTDKTDLKQQLIEELSDHRIVSDMIAEMILKKYVSIFSADEEYIKIKRSFYNNNSNEAVDKKYESVKESQFFFSSDTNEQILWCEYNENDLSVYMFNEVLFLEYMDQKKNMYKNKNILLIWSAAALPEYDLCIKGIYIFLKYDEKFLDQYEQRSKRNRMFVFLFSIIIISAVFWFIGKYVYTLFWVEQLKTDFLNIASHELMTPLSAVKLYADTLTDTTETDKITEYSHIISSKATQMKNMISNLLYFNKLSDHKHIYSLQQSVRNNFAEIDSSAFIEQLCDEYAACYFKEYTLNVEGRSSLFTDTNIFSIIMSNLIDNSFKYCNKKNVNIAVKLTENDHEFCIEYSDKNNAQNVDVEGILKKYRRSHCSSSKGFGLGLYITDQLIQLLGGNMKAEKQDDSLMFTIHLQKQ